jgi:hypothetical protein
MDEYRRDQGKGGSIQKEDELVETVQFTGRAVEIKDE